MLTPNNCAAIDSCRVTMEKVGRMEREGKEIGYTVLILYPPTSPAVDVEFAPSRPSSELRQGISDFKLTADFRLTGEPQAVDRAHKRPVATQQPWRLWGAGVVGHRITLLLPARRAAF